jgi:hypothetical protein
MTTKPPRVLAVLVLALGALCFAASSSADKGHHGDNGKHNGAGNNVRFTTTLTSTDSGTCGQAPWATDTLKRTYVVHRGENGTYTLTVFDRGSFTTLAAPSPGACETSSNHGHAVTAGITGKVIGYLRTQVTGGTFNPNATCATDCSRAAFVAAFFGASATQSCDVDQNCRYAYLYQSHDKALQWHHWLDAGRAGATGGLTTVDRGDIATT